MKYRVRQALIMLFFFLSFGTNELIGQTLSPVNESSPKQSNKRRFNIYYHLGSVELPEGYKGYLRESFGDAWFGWIESPDGDFKINWSVGLVESIFEKYEKHFEWTKTETTTRYAIKFGLMRENKKESLAASIAGRDVQFSAAIKTEKEKDLFMEIVHSYQQERCDVCRTFPFKPRGNN